MESTSEERTHVFPGPLKKARICFSCLRYLLLSAVVLLSTFASRVQNSREQQTALSKGRASADAAEAGKKLFDSNCAGCHGLDARGGEHAPNIATNPELQRMSDEQLFRTVHDGAASGSMPAFGAILSDDKIKAVGAYLRSLQGHSGGEHTPLPGDPAAGKLLFFGKAACSQCHSIVDSGAGSGAGGFLASDLTDYARSREPAEILRAITNPNDNLNPRARTAIIVTQDGQRLTGFIRNQDNFSIQFQSLDGAFHLLERSGLASVTYDPLSSMPADYGERLTSAELNNLVSFLMRTAAVDQASSGQRKGKHDDEDENR
jgi:putative heme-binding domain-containing protein